MLSAKQLDELKANVAAVNLAHGYANKLYPLLANFFREFVGQKIIKQDGTILEKIKKRMPEFPATEGNPGQDKHATIHTYKHSSDYSLAWTVKVCQPLGEHGCFYYETTVYIGDMGYGGEREILKGMPENYGEPRRDDYTVEEMQAKIADFEAAKKAMEDARGELYPFDKYTR